MSKQIYIDSNGNEVLVSGTVATAGNLPLGTDFSDPTSTAGAIANLDKRKIQFKSVTGTTTAGGVIDLGLDYNDYLVLSAEVLTTYGTMFCFPVASQADSKTYARVFDENLTKVSSQSVAIWVAYYKHT